MNNDISNKSSTTTTPTWSTTTSSTIIATKNKGLREHYQQQKQSDQQRSHDQQQEQPWTRLRIATALLGRSLKVWTPGFWDYKYLWRWRSLLSTIMLRIYIWSAHPPWGQSTLLVLTPSPQVAEQGPQLPMLHEPDPPCRAILTPHHIILLSTWRRRIPNGRSPVLSPSSSSSKVHSTHDNYQHEEECIPPGRSP